MASSKPKSTRNPKEKLALETLLELTQLLTDSRPLEESLRAVTDAALELVPANHASIRLLDATHTELLSGARSGEGQSARPMTFRRGEGVIGWVVDYREGVRIPDVEQDARYKAMAARQGFVIKSLMAEPLWSAGHVIGVLSVAAPEVDAFTEEDQLLVRLLANCCAPPIERARLRRLAMTDDLTLAYNHRYFSPRFNEELERSRRTGQPVSLLIMDLDHFKKVNDTYGHAVGDAVLRTFADRVRSFVRKLDVFIRRGGEEFLLVMPGTSLDQAKATAERIRRKIGERPIEIGSGESVRQTVSMGIATWDGRESPEALEKRADRALYNAKQGGRDRVCVAAASETSLLPASLRGK
jgi:diguanylate cyclase (GGDEF)-like protein